MVIKFLSEFLVLKRTAFRPGNCTAKLLSLVNKYNFRRDTPIFTFDLNSLN